MDAFFNMKEIFTSTATSAVVIYGIFRFYLEKRIIITLSDRQSVVDKQRAAFDIYLDLLAKRVAGDPINYSGFDWRVEFAQASKDVLLWCPNDVVRPLARYAVSVNDGSENETLLADAIIKFRKSIGYKNLWWNKIDASNVVSIYRAGN